MVPHISWGAPSSSSQAFLSQDRYLGLCKLHTLKLTVWLQEAMLLIWGLNDHDFSETAEVGRTLWVNQDQAQLQQGHPEQLPIHVLIHLICQRKKGKWFQLEHSGARD